MIPIPNAQRSLLEQDSGNAALYFARMTPYEGPGGKPQKDAIATLGKNINRRLNQDILTAIHAHQTDILKTAARDGTVWELTATLRSPFVSGLGSGHPTETGFTLDRNSGLPFIPASSIKGVLRLACALHLADKEPGSVQKQLDKQGQWTGQWEIPDRHPLFRRYFGDTDSSKKDSVRGQLCFLDAFPTNCGDILKIDIINPHFREYYGGSDEGPVETEKPNPKKFLAVKEGTAFVFRSLPCLCLNGLRIAPMPLCSCLLTARMSKPCRLCLKWPLASWALAAKPVWAMAALKYWPSGTVRILFRPRLGRVGCVNLARWRIGAGCAIWYSTKRKPCNGAMKLAWRRQ